MGGAIAIFVPLFMTFFLIFLAMWTSDKREQEKTRARRLAEHKMNARLVKLNL
jgi:hypothetical protein